MQKKYPNKKSIRDGAKMVDSYFKLSFQFKKVSPFEIGMIKITGNIILNL